MTPADLTAARAALARVRERHADCAPGVWCAQSSAFASADDVPLLAAVAEAAARLAVAAIVDWCRRISRLVAIQRLVPTPWHYKRARVELRRAGQSVTGQAVLTLACQLRMSTDG